MDYKEELYSKQFDEEVCVTGQELWQIFKNGFDNFCTDFRIKEKKQSDRWNACKCYIYTASRQGSVDCYINRTNREVFQILMFSVSNKFE